MKNNEVATNTLVDTSLSILQVPEVADRLRGHSDQLRGALSRVTHTEVGADGFVKFRSELASIPLIVMGIGESAVLHASDSVMNPYQAISLTEQVGQEKAAVASQKFRDHLCSSGSHKVLPVFEDKEGLAVTGSNWWIPKSKIIIEGRPYVLMNADSRVGTRLSPVVFLHELMHVLQKEAHPVRDTDNLPRDKVRGELEAFYVAAQIILGMKDANRHRELLGHTPRDEMDRARDIEMTRLSSQDNSDPFDPNDKVISALVGKKHKITKELGLLIDPITRY